jgi:hypothetical protein
MCVVRAGCECTQQDRGYDNIGGKISRVGSIFSSSFSALSPLTHECRIDRRVSNHIRGGVLALVLISLEGSNARTSRVQVWLRIRRDILKHVVLALGLRPVNMAIYGDDDARRTGCDRSQAMRA